MKIGIIVQARMGSTRLPGKILKEFYKGQTLLEVLLAKLHKVPNATVIVATSDNPNNDALEDFLKEKHELVYRGSEDDVLSRFIGAADQFGIDGVIRICSDNPFIDLDGLKKLASAASQSKDVDYMGFRINNKPSILTHFGFWGEFVTTKALKKVAEITSEKSAHEHVTYYVYNHPETFTCDWLTTPTSLDGKGNIRLTIDTPEDLENAKLVFQSLMEQDENYTLEQVVEFLDHNTKIKDSMARIIEQNIKK